MENLSLIDVNKPEKLKQAINELIEYKNNASNITAADLGLENVDNTSDINKPVSDLQKMYIDSQNAVQNTAMDTLKNRMSDAETALLDKASFTYVDERIESLIGAAPDTLDTFEEVKKAFDGNDDIIEALNNAIGSKASKSELVELENRINANLPLVIRIGG